MLKRLLVVLGVLLMLVIAGVAFAISRLGSLLTERAQVAAAEAGKTLGRKVELQSVDVSLFPPLSVEVRGLKVGPAEGEPKPLVTVDRVAVRVDAMAAARSSGKDLQVLDAEVSGLTVNVLRFADGTTNVERLQARLEAGQKPEEKEAPSEPTDLSGLVVHRAALVDGRFALLDQATPGAQELQISDVDLEVRDLRVGQSLEVILKAAVLGTTQNFEVVVKTTPLGPGLEAVPQAISISAQGIDLGPMGPFMGSEVGLRAGKLDAAWKLSPGALVPGGSGPSTVAGSIQAKGLSFAAAEQGKPLDVVLETDVQLDSVAGSADIKTLRFVFGPAQLTGKGRVEKLWTGTPAMDGFELLLLNLNLDELTGYYPPLRKQLGGQVGGALSLHVRGEGSANTQALVAKLDLTGARLNVPDQLTKAAGAKLELRADVSGAAAQQALRFKVDADLSGVDLRPGKSLNKGPGQPFALKTQGKYEGGATTKVSLESLSVTLLEDVLTGQASVELGAGGKPNALAFRFDGRAKKLDADKLLLPAPAEGEAAAPVETPDPTRFDGMTGEVALVVDQLRYGEQDLQDVLVKLKMVNDKLTLERMSVRTFGGRIAMDGSEFRLGPARMPYQLNLQLEGVDLAAALEKRMPKKVLSGKLNGSFTFAGEGFTVNDLAETLSGAMKGDVNSGAYAGLDIVGSATQALSKAVPFASKSAQAGRGGGGSKSLSLGNLLPFSMTVEKGVARLSKPLALDDKTAALTATGGFKLTGDLALDGIVNLKPETVKTLTGGKVSLDSPLPIPFKIVGPAWAPRIEDMDVKPAAKLLLEKGGRAALSQALGGKDQEAEKLAREKAAAAQAALDAEKAALQQRQAEEKAKAEAAVKAAAAKKKKAAEEQAKKKLKGIF